MLEANKNIWFEKVFSIYNRNLLKRRFNSLEVSNLECLSNKDYKVPLIIYANHSSWWDGLVFWEIIRHFEFEFYVMMEEKHLRNFYLFRKLGAFSVVRENPRQAVRTINYAAGLLRDDPNRSVLIFPQGEILPNDIRPLRLFSGLSRIVEKTPRCSVVPVALRYEFAGSFRPEIYCKVGSSQTFETVKRFDSKKITEILEKHLTETLDDLKREVTSQTLDEFKKIF